MRRIIFSWSFSRLDMHTFS